MKKVLVIGNVFPEPTSSAAGTKMMQWLHLFKANDFQTVYASTSPQSEFSADLTEFTTDTWLVEMNNSSFNEQLRTFQPDIVLYDRFMVEEQFSWRVRETVPSAIHLLE
ncbi:MAG TPA: glycosyltransferase, partial [Crocinitomicaceae bacterium]|nr:glycosyltransferase [Crocinitomicaceae bacterium]